MISQSVEYALRAAVYLATTGPERATGTRIAAATRVPAPYLAKVLNALVKAGLVDAQRGRGGGLKLARPAAAVTILEIVNAVDPLPRIRTCPLGLSAHGTRLCALHARLDAAMAGVERAFRESTLAEVIAEPNGSVPLCNERRPTVSLGVRGKSPGR
jgi:Rrf2 family protein